jgi:hypothetical protein
MRICANVGISEDLAVIIKSASAERLLKYIVQVVDDPFSTRGIPLKGTCCGYKVGCEPEVLYGGF